MKKLLLVDDSSTSRMLVQMMLRPCPNYHCLTASNGEEAVAKALDHQPDIVLMDVVMPVMNGLEACRQLRLHQRTRSVPVVLVSTRSEPGDWEAGFRSGCNDYLTKPLDGKELLRVLKSYLGE